MNKDEWHKIRTIKTGQNIPPKRIVYVQIPDSAKIILDAQDFVNLPLKEPKFYEHLGWNIGIYEQYCLFLERIKKELLERDEINLDEIDRELMALDCYDISTIFLEKGMAAVVDIEKANMVVDHITVEDSGFIKGPLFGGGKIEYKLPSGKVFLGREWVS